jgi:phosphoadenosine phosphosulfate reductase
MDGATVSLPAGSALPDLSLLSAEDRIAWALAHLPGVHALSSSFGAQAAVLLHMATRIAPKLPVILIDTGHLFPETYRFVDELSERLSLNLHVYGPKPGAAWLAARHGPLWEQGLAGIEHYNRLHKVEPMQRALAELGVGTWIAGLRRSQSRSRAATPILDQQGGRHKLHPIADWSDREVWLYLKQHDLPWHPLWHQGYVSIGDVHSTRPLGEVSSEEETRFGGLKRECGLHERW